MRSRIATCPTRLSPVTDENESCCERHVAEPNPHPQYLTVFNLVGAMDFTDTTGPGTDGYSVVWDNDTGKFVLLIGGSSDHADLDNLDYANAGHTDFAGTQVANTFARQQTIQTSIADAPLGSELLVNNSFATDLSGWTDDGSGWVWSSGAATHTPGLSGVLSQVVAVSAGNLFVLEMSITGMSTGSVEVYDDFNLAVDTELTENGIFQDIQYVAAASDTITIEVSDDFDGRIEYVSFKLVLEGGYPAAIVLRDRFGDRALELRSKTPEALYIGNQAGQLSENANIGIGSNALGAIVAQFGNVALGNGAGVAATANNGLYLGNNVGASEAVDNTLHIGNNSTLSLIKGKMATTAAGQEIRLNARLVILPSLPVSSVGLPAGALWNDGGTLKIV